MIREWRTRKPSRSLLQLIRVGGALQKSCAHARLAFGDHALAGRFAARGPAPFTPASVEWSRHGSNGSCPCFRCGAYAHRNVAPCSGARAVDQLRRDHAAGGRRGKGARSELASGAATGGGEPQAPPTRISTSGIWRACEEE